MSRFLFGVRPRDPASYAVAATALLVTALVTYIPARRATKVTPLTALRAEGGGFPAFSTQRIQVKP